MNKDKYILELSIEQIFMLDNIIKNNNLYKSSYEPLKDIVDKINIFRKDIKRIV